jgi:hypothetical protein
MPKPDGTLYWYEKARIEEQTAPKKAKPKVSSKSGKRRLSPASDQNRAVLSEPVGVTKPLHLETSAEVSSQKQVSDCDSADSSNVVSINGGEPIRKKSGPKPGLSNHPLMPPKGKAGRPVVRIKATPALIAGICESIKGGLSIESSCILHGITRTGVDRWRKINPAVNSQFEKAEVQFEADLVGKMKGFASNDVKAASWLLERRLSRSWAQVSKNELTGKDGGPVKSLSLAKEMVGGMGAKVDQSLSSPRSAQPLKATG